LKKTISKDDMKGMILAAGLGTRLNPITNDLPKALVKIGNTTLLEFAIRKLLYYGFDDIIINIHHYPDMIIEFLNKNKNFGASITISDERDLLLDTGGGLKKASYFFNDNKPFIIYNCDIVTDLNLQALYQDHIKQKSIATLAIRDRETSRYFLFNDDNNLCGWWNKRTGERKPPDLNIEGLKPKAFSGIQIIDPKALKLFTDYKVFSLVDFYLRIAISHKIIGYDHTDSMWADIGKPSELEEMQSKNNLLSYL
jgi:NDP-sugar pyrophosphorylase family protein